MQQGLFLVLVPMPRVRQEVAQTRQRFSRPMATDLGVVAIAAGVIGSRVVAQAVGERFDQGRTEPLPRPRERPLRHRADGDDIITIDLLAGNAGGDGLLRQSSGGGLLFHAGPRSPRHCY